MNKFGLKDTLDKQIYQCYNFLTDLNFFTQLETRAALKKNSLYKNKYTNQDCYILGTGPSLSSLSNSECQYLANEITFGVNSFYKSNLANIINPTFYTLMDNIYWGKWSYTFQEILTKQTKSPPIFITDIRAYNILSELTLGEKQPIFLYAKKYPVNSMDFNITKNIYGAMNVVSFSILSAMFMGFKNIYLLGCDFNAFCNLGYGHCYDDSSEASENRENLAYYLRFYWITLEFHYLLAKLANKSGINVINCTPNSLLDAYPHSNLQTVLIKSS